MTSFERIIAAVQFKTTDRVPVMPQVFGHAATLAGVTLEDYVRDGVTLARCQLQALKRYGYDAVFSVMDVNVETEAAGSVLKYRTHQYPTVERYVLSPESDLSASAVPDPRQDGRMPEMLKALSILRQTLGNDVLVVGCVMGPFTLAAQLLGLEEALYLAVDDTPRFERVMDFATEIIIRYGQAQVQAGAHLPVVFDPCSSPAALPPQFFRQFALPRLRRVFQAMSAAGSQVNWLHIAGPTIPILAAYPEAGVNLACFDYVVSGLEARRELPTTSLSGNIRPLAFVESDPADIKAQAVSLIRTSGGSGFILSSGCEIPPESKPENVAALTAAAARQPPRRGGF